MQSSGKIGLPAVLITAVCVAVAIAHWPALSAKVLSFDDQQYFTDNVLVQNPGFVSVKRFLTEVLEPSTVQGYYQPLTMISLMGDYAVGGRENNLRPFHITNLALHTANTALIIVLLYMLFGNIWAAAAAGLLFGVHPMTVEPIPWVGERKTLLAAFFALWSLILYVCYSRSCGWKSYTGCFVLYLLALLSKPTSVPLPAVMLLMDYWPLKRLRIKSVIEKVPLFVLGGIFAVITYISQHRTAATVSPIEYGYKHVLLVLCHNIIFYLCKIVLPINLSSHYAFPKPFNLVQPMVLAGVFGTCVLITLLIVSLRWTRAAFTGWLIFFAAIFPTMGVIGFTNVIASDKFAYLPSIGLLMTTTSFLIWLGKSSKIKMTVVVVLILAGAESAATQRYLVYWQDSITLTNHMLALTPDAAPLYNNRGIAYNSKNMYDAAVTDFNKALEIDPRFVEAYNNRGNAYAKSKAKYDFAISDFNKAIEIDPRYAKTYNNRGIAYNGKGEYDLAISDYDKAIEINPGYAEAYNNRGAARNGKGEYDLAVSDYNKAIEINPRYAEAYYNRGNVYAKGKGEYDLAISDYNKAIEINPELADAYTNRGDAYRNKGQLDLAIADCSKAIELNPKYAEAYNNRGIVYCEKREFDLAVVDYNKAIEINPRYAEAWYNRGTVCYQKGEYDRAISDYDKALEINPRYGAAYFNKAGACERTGRKTEAIETYKAFIQYAPALEARYIEYARQRLKELER